MKKSIKAVLISIIMIGLVGCSNGKTKDSNELVIYATRHGKTIFNTMDRVQGWADTPLTEEGIEVAEYLGLGLKEENVSFSNVYTSDLGRSKETAHVVLNKMGQEKYSIQELKEFREASYGKFEGDFNSNMSQAIAEFYGFKDAGAFAESTDQFWVDAANALHEIDPNAEDSKTIIDRMQAGLNKIAEENPNGGNILLVGHGMSISLLVESLVEDKNSFEGHLPNASVTKITYKDGKFIVESIGDVSYIEKGKSVK